MLDLSSLTVLWSLFSVTDFFLLKFRLFFPPLHIQYIAAPKVSCNQFGDHQWPWRGFWFSWGCCFNMYQPHKHYCRLCTPPHGNCTEMSTTHFNDPNQVILWTVEFKYLSCYFLAIFHSDFVVCGWFNNKRLGLFHNSDNVCVFRWFPRLLLMHN